MQDGNSKKNVGNFLLLWKEEIATLINKKACEDQANQKRDKKIILPSRKGIKKLYNYLKSKIIEFINLLNETFCQHSWTKLIKHALIFIQIFNGMQWPDTRKFTENNFAEAYCLTFTSLLNVEDAAADKLANFMGHHKVIYKNVYCVSVPVAESTCISKLLANTIGDGNDDDDGEIYSNHKESEVITND